MDFVKIKINDQNLLPLACDPFLSLILQTAPMGPLELIQQFMQILHWGAQTIIQTNTEVICFIT